MTGKKQLTLEQRVLEYIRRHRLIEAGQKVLVAVSGGADSVCLLYTLYRLREELGITLHVAHLNHRLRGEESDADARYTASLAQALGIPATIEKADVSGYRAEHRLSVEEAAREVRYSFLAKSARDIGAALVATGHTLNDQVETILLHIIRGTGTRGLRGLQPRHTMGFSGRSLTVIRPLLEIKRQETEEYCSLQGLKPCLDTSNLSLSLLRNRVRHELLPLLESYNPGIQDSLLRISRIAGDELDFLDAESTRIWEKAVRREGETLVLDRALFRSLPRALQRHLFRRAVEELLGTLKDIETRHIESLLEALGRPAGRRIVLPEGLVFDIEYDCYLLGFHPEELAPFPELEGIYDIRIPGRTEIPGWSIEASVISGRRLPSPEDEKFTACFDFDLTGNKIKVRSRRRGDRFQPLGMDGLKKVGVFMLDARIPRSWRERVPVFVTPRQIIWIAGWRIDERVRITEKTRNILCLKLVRENGPGRRSGTNS